MGSRNFAFFLPLDSLQRQTTHENQILARHQSWEIKSALLLNKPFLNQHLYVTVGVVVDVRVRVFMRYDVFALTI